jgi:manganese/zinc/iron transport system permease protein
MNPYSGANFFEFFGILFGRIFSGSPLVSDEIQLAVLSCCALACGVVGPFLVLKRMTMFANSLSHTTLLGVVLAFLFASQWGLLVGALASALLTAGLTALFTRFFRLQEDASIGLVFTSLFALGIALVSVYAKNTHLSTEAVMGNCDALQLSDLRVAGWTALFNVGVVGIFYRKLLVVSFDEAFSKVLGLSTFAIKALIYFTTALTCVASFRAVGALVVLALLTGPYLIARLFCHRLPHLLILTPTIGIIVSAIAVVLSRAILSQFGLALSTSGLIAALLAVIFVGSILCRKERTGYAGSAMPAG